jgi:DNA-directed RNA polymerase specialized sigma24 family protein
MGSVKRDLHIAERALDATYPALNSPTGLRILLSDYHALTQRRYAGDTAASDVLIDLATAVELAGLTARQRQALALVYGEDLTQVEAGKRMGLAQNTVSEALDRALEAVAEVYWYWSAQGEGYTEGESA